MNEQLQKFHNDAKELMKKAIQHLETELLKIRAGKASPQIVEGIHVDYYGTPTLINQIGNVVAVDARTLTIQPWEKNMLQPIERAIINSNIGINPQNDGVVIRLFMPPLTEERRKEMVKKSNNEGEQSKITIRNIRRDAIEQVKKLQKEGMSEDDCKDAESDIQDLTNKYIGMVEKHLETKEKEIMTV
jgi:ribosome recycling factor